MFYAIRAAGPVLPPREPLALPYDWRPVIGARRHCDVVACDIPSEPAGAAKAVARSLRDSRASFFLASYAAILRGIIGNRDIVIAVATTVRYEKGFTDVVGHFVDRLLIRSTVRPDSRFRNVGESVRTAVFSGLGHRALPVLETSGRRVRQEARPVHPSPR